ncbi:MAG: hypothetical protein WCS99_07250 [Limisphaerales bacterium]
MNRRDDELNELLRAVRVPERAPEYWEKFPQTVVRQLRRAEAGEAAGSRGSPGRSGGHLWAWGLGLATACLVLGFFAGFRRGHSLGFSAAELAQSRKIYHELAGLFPDQLQTVLLDGRGSQLVLASDAQPPASVPLLVQICHDGICRRFITFSGQRVALNGETFEILFDARGNVLVVGDRLAWSSGEPRKAAAGYRIRATALGEAL